MSFGSFWTVSSGPPCTRNTAPGRFWNQLCDICPNLLFLYQLTTTTYVLHVRRIRLRKTVNKICSRVGIINNRTWNIHAGLLIHGEWPRHHPQPVWYCCMYRVINYWTPHIIGWLHSTNGSNNGSCFSSSDKQWTLGSAHCWKNTSPALHTVSQPPACFQSPESSLFFKYGSTDLILCLASVDCSTSSTKPLGNLYGEMIEAALLVNQEVVMDGLPVSARRSLG